MSSVNGRLDFKDSESHLESCSASSSNGSKHISSIGYEDAQDSDGNDSCYIPQNVNEKSKGKAISKPIPESSPLKSLDDESEDLVETALQDMLSSECQRSVVSLIPAIRGGRQMHGRPLQRRRVSWAEDVYDPPPSIVSHYFSLTDLFNDEL